MWDRDLVLETVSASRQHTREEAGALIREFPDGNSIANEGCMLACLAMVLRYLDIRRRQRDWTPARLNQEAHERGFYSLSGFSIVPLYADLVLDLSHGEVQLSAKEEYLSGESNWPATYLSDCSIARAYRTLPKSSRRHFMLMVKTGTYDDTIGSHFVLLHPDHPESPDVDDAIILDPAMRRHSKHPWRLTDSAEQICRDRAILKAWTKKKIKPTQVAGVWLFARWPSRNSRSLLDPLVHALAHHQTT